MMTDYLAPAPFACNTKTPREVSIEIIRAVAKGYDVKFADIFTRTQRHPVAIARCHAYGILKKNGLSYGQIGILFDRDRTTICSGIKRAKELGL